MTEREKTYAERLLGDAEIGRWYRNVARGSKITATVRSSGIF